MLGTQSHIKQTPASNLRITDINFELRGRFVHVSWVDGRENSRTQSFEANEVALWLYENLSIPFSKSMHFIEHHFTAEHMRRFLKSKGEI